MKNIFSSLILLVTLTVLLNSCSKVADSKDLSKAVVQIAAPISDTGCLSGAIKGTMLAGKTYHVCGDIIVNRGDTLVIQEGVKVKFEGSFGLGVKGSLICLGSKEKPNWFTYDSATLVKTDNIGADPSKDPALKGLWTGILGDTSCNIMVIKWTHVEFAGGKASKTLSAISKPYPIYFANPYGTFVLEDSWLYGSVDDPIRTLGGKIAVLRNTFEKCGLAGGEALNAKAGTVGDFAYNLCIGIATNGPKLSNSGAITGVAGSNLHIYNNTIVNCGYRRAAAGRGGSINFEQDAAGLAYNNIIVNCKFGVRIVANPIADTANIRYGYNLNYGDSASVVNQFIPSTSISTAITAPQSTNIPNDYSFLPTGWKLGDTYTAPTSIIGANNPMFINAPVPLPAGVKLQDISVVGNYNFRLQSTSPCIGKGFTGFSPRGDVPVDAKYGVTELTPPGKDIGAYQYDGTGNQH